MDFQLTDIIAVVIPLLTFFLGVAFSHWTRKGERSDEVVEANAILLADAVTAWHQRLYEISAAEAKGDEAKLTELLVDYEQNRHELPKIIRSLEALRESRRASSLVDLGERFLDTFTEQRGRTVTLYCTRDHLFDKGSISRQSRKVCSALTQSSAWQTVAQVKNTDAGEKFRDAEIRKFKLNHSDELVQAINRQVGRMHRRR